MPQKTTVAIVNYIMSNKARAAVTALCIVVLILSLSLRDTRRAGAQTSKSQASSDPAATGRHTRRFRNPTGRSGTLRRDSRRSETSTNMNAALVTFTVTNAEDAGAGSLRAAIASANGNGIEPDNITFDPAFFNTPRTITLLTALPNITGSLSIQGPGPHLLTVRRNYPAPDFTIFNIPASELEVSLSGLTISNGRDLGVGAGFDGYGGGIDSFSHLTLTNLHVTGNNADTGGGVALTFADGLFTDCTFSGNAANFDGAIFYQGDGNYTLRLVNNTISGNDARGVGGGIGHFSDTDSSRVEVVNSTIVNNTAVFGEGGVRTLTEGGGSATTTLRNTIIAQNTPANLVASGSGASVTSLGFNLSENGNGFLTGAGDQPTAQPLLGPLALNGGRAPTHALLGGSPALDKGVSAGASTDQRGLPRIFNIATISDAGDGADIGAVEMQALIVTTDSDVGDGTCDSTCTLREAITTANGNGAGLDDITFETAFFNTARTINLLTVLPDLTSSVTMSGPGAHLLTVRRGDGAADFRIFRIPSGVTSVGISGLSISNGRAAGEVGGGIDSQSHLTLTNVHVTGNHANNGGGVSLQSADGVFIGCAFSGNTAVFRGGGIFHQGDGNHMLRVINNTVSGNTSGNAGGGILNLSTNGNSTLEVINSTIAINMATNAGGGILALTEGAGTTATTTLRNSLIANNTPTNLAVSGSGASVTSLGFNLSDNGNGFLTQSTDKSNAFTGLAPLANNGGPTPTHALLGGSAALDAGNNSGSGVATDQRGAGFRRTVSLPILNQPGGDGTDIGAFEAATEPTTPSFAIDDVTMLEGNSGTTNFVFTVTLSGGAEAQQPITVKYQTADGTATAPADYTALPLTTLSFAPGETSKQVSVVVNGETVVEANETFFVNLSEPFGAILFDHQGTRHDHQRRHGHPDRDFDHADESQPDAAGYSWLHRYV